ncbi:hypothetical protein [Paenibacillus thermotolerans]|uniref:hypothetical protein n=1 Tax=Paenibacillus thermotolerans TaxID=3027807 RepID=UPI002368D5E8|nr:MULTISPECIES: hypothetical protein [unclassified Paenibacillus]
MEKIAQRVIVITGGRAIAEGTPIELCEAHGTNSLEDLYMKVTDAAYSKGDIA